MTLFSHDPFEVLAPADETGALRKMNETEVASMIAELMAVADIGATSGGGLIYTLRSVLLLNLAAAINTSAWVIGDPTVGYNGIYMKSAAAGVAGWTRVGDLPYSFILAANAGAGTANAIVATTPSPVPTADGGALIILPILADNTVTPVTVAFNGEAALTIKTASGGNVAIGGLTAGMLVAGFENGTTFRLISDQASAAIQAAAEAAQAAAELARDQAVAAAASVGSPTHIIARVVDINSGAVATGYEAGDVIDGVTLVAGDIILRATLSGNAADGLYVASSSGAAARLGTITTYNQMCGLLVTIQEGSKFADTSWRGKSNRGGTLDSTALEFVILPGSSLRAGIAHVDDFGADPTGATSSQTAFNNALAAIVATGNKGIVQFGDGTYLLPSGAVVDTTGSVILRGVGWLATLLTTGTNNVCAIDLKNGRHGVEDLGCLGYNATNCSGSSHNIRVRSSCVDVALNRLFLAFGYHGILNEAHDTRPDSIIVLNTYGSLFYNNSVAAWPENCKFDNPWPVSVPTYGSSFGAWSAGAVVTAGMVRSTGGFYLQCSQGGTTHATTAPTVPKYGDEVTDGTAKWKLACATTSTAVTLTTGSSEIHMSNCDLSGAQGLAGLRIDNDGAGVAPFIIDIKGTCISQTIGPAVNARAGHGLVVSAGCEMTPGFQSGEAAIAFANAWSGNATIADSIFFGTGGAIHIYIGAGSRTVVHGCQCGGAATAAIVVEAAISNVNIMGNNLGHTQLGGANAKPFAVGTGAGDRINIVYNITNGATGAGTNGASGGSVDVTTGNF